MAFTNPPTRATTTVITASIYNTDLIDNLAYIYANSQGTDYTPTWSATGTAPSLGNGSIQGKYWRLGRLVLYRLVFTAGSTTTFGSGAWLFTLPFTAADALGNGSVIMKDNSAGLIKLGASFYASVSALSVTYDGDTFIGVNAN